jgi:hypothetical protein
MARKLDTFDTTWFNLKNYYAVKGFGLGEWYTQVSIRNYMWWCADNNLDEFRRLCNTWIEVIKTNPIIPDSTEENGQWEGQHDIDPELVSSVYSTPAMYFWFALHENELNDVWHACNLENKLEATEEQIKLAYTPLDLLYLKRGIDCGECANIFVELAATDEQLIDDFKKWLSTCREAYGYHSFKNNFTEKDFAAWYKWRVLPYWDLLLVAKAEQKEIKKKRIARIIFSDDTSASGDELAARLRRSTKPRAKWLMRAETPGAMLAQLKGMA